MATAKISRIVSDFETSLSGAISIGATSFTIQSATDLDGNLLSDGTYCFTIDRDNTDAKEYLVGQLDASEKTVSSVSSVSRQGVLTANAQIAHRVGSNVIISDHSILSSLSRVFNGVDTIDPASPIAYTSNPTLSSAGQLATKGYVDSVVTGGTVNTDRVILGSQTAGETVAAGNIVYLKTSDSRWWKADADISTTFKDVQLGVALGAGTAGNAISGGVQLSGLCGSFTGLTANTAYYLSSTAGGVSTSVGSYSVLLGTALSTTEILFNPQTITTPSAYFAIPVGTILPYGASTSPTGYLACDGSAVSRTTYADLFAVLSTNYGAGDGSTTFNVPDFKSRTIVGYSASAPTKVFTFSSRSSNTITVTSDVLTNSSTNEIQTGQAVLYSAPSGAISGLTDNTTYYLVRVAYNQFQLATSVANANQGVVISLSSNGTGTQTFTVTYSARAIGEKGGTETDTTVPIHSHYPANSTGVGGSITRAVNTASDDNALTAETSNFGTLIGSTGSSTPNNMPLFGVANYIIKH
jgi:microcystin-dependent protein